MYTRTEYCATEFLYRARGDYHRVFVHVLYIRRDNVISLVLVVTIYRNLGSGFQRASFILPQRTDRRYWCRNSVRRSGIVSKPLYMSNFFHPPPAIGRSHSFLSRSSVTEYILNGWDTKNLHISTNVGSGTLWVRIVSRSLYDRYYTEIIDRWNRVTPDDLVSVLLLHCTVVANLIRWLINGWISHDDWWSACAHPRFRKVVALQLQYLVGDIHGEYTFAMDMLWRRNEHNKKIRA